MKNRDAIIGFIVLVTLVTGFVLIRNSKKDKLVIPSNTPSIEQKVSDKFGGFILPKDTERVELKDISGGNAFGIATRTEVLADLPDISAGSYQVWVDGKRVGDMRIAKGGFLFEGKLDGMKIEVKLQGNTILEGSF